MYLIHTPLDISFAISIISQFLSNPSVDHLEAVISILRYMKKYLRKGLMFRKTINQTLEDILMLIGLDLLVAKNPHLDIAHLYGEIW